MKWCFCCEMFKNGIEFESAVDAFKWWLNDSTTLVVKCCNTSDCSNGPGDLSTTYPTTKTYPVEKDNCSSDNGVGALAIVLIVVFSAIAFECLWFCCCWLCEKYGLIEPGSRGYGSWVTGGGGGDFGGGGGDGGGGGGDGGGC